MNIKITPKDGYKGVFTLFVDDTPWRDIHSAIFGRKPKLSFSSTDLEEQFLQVEYKAALLFSLKKLSFRAQLSEELRKTLHERYVSKSTIEKILEECQSQGYLNDEEWLNSYIRGQLSRKQGPRAIVMKLRAKGIPTERTEEVLSKLDNQEERQKRIQLLLSTRYRTRDLTDRRTRDKVIGALMRKGFGLDDILEILNL